MAKKQVQGVNKEDMRVKNRGLVLRLICCSDRPVTRAAITGLIGLSKMTVTNIVSDWMQAGFVTELERMENGTVGRNPAVVEMAPNAPLCVGLCLSRDLLVGIVCDLRLNRLCRREIVLSGETALTLQNALFAMTDDLMAAFPGRKWLGIGVAAPGPLDRERGVILSPTDFFGITDFPVSQLLHNHYGLPVVLGNDMNASALAERMYGDGRELSNFIYLGISRGIGAGVITDGRLYRDSSGFVGEVGHLSVCCNGPKCSCGSRGCLEVYANWPVILERLTKAMGHPVTDNEMELCWHNERGRRVLTDVIDKLAVAITGLVNLLDPEAIFLGQNAICLPEHCLEQLEDRVNRIILARGYRKVIIRRSSFGMDAPSLGSAALVLDRLFSGHLPAIQQSTADPLC